MKLVKVVLLALVLLGLTSVAGAELYWESDVLKDKALKAGQTEIASSMTEWTLGTGEKVQAVMATHNLVAVKRKSQKVDLAFVVVISREAGKMPETEGLLLSYETDQGEVGTIEIEQMRRTGDETKVIFMTGQANPDTLTQLGKLKPESSLTLVVPLLGGEKLFIPVSKEVLREWQEVLAFSFSKKEIEKFIKKTKALE